MRKIASMSVSLLYLLLLSIPGVRTTERRELQYLFLQSGPVVETTQANPPSPYSSPTGKLQVSAVRLAQPMRFMNRLVPTGQRIRFQFSNPLTQDIEVDLTESDAKSLLEMLNNNWNQSKSDSVKVQWKFQGMSVTGDTEGTESVSTLTLDVPEITVLLSGIRPGQELDCFKKWLTTALEENHAK
jgi:hypothetical protein